MAYEAVSKQVVTRWKLKCERCGHAWETLGAEIPWRCASCKSRYWDVPSGVLPKGRPDSNDAEDSEARGGRGRGGYGQ